jgi:ABC-type bacteriocin/lantibiotic exporter with double-glycine peptidase domain
MKIALQQLNSIRASGLISECVETPTPEAGLKEEHKLDYARPPSIAIEGLFYRYPNCSEFIVNNLTLSIGSGEQIGIVGKSGSGKSTVLAIILGILKPTAGSVRFDGEAPSERLKFGAKFIGYVGAEPFLIDGTIRDNLCYGCLQEVTDAMCWEALTLADLDRTVQGMAGQLAYKIAENGDGLSAGQKQRLSLARALLLRPSLLVLDEVSANLDADTELEIANSIRSLKRKCTVVIVSHRPGIIKYADRVVELAAK